MAIVVPFLMSSTAVGSAIGLTGSIAGAIGGALGGVSAAVVSTVASVAFQVTGVNDKINKAASKVFGEDLVGFANIAGAVYGAVNGGFDIGKGADAAGGAASAIDASSAGAINGMDAASDAFSAANSAAGGSLVSDGMGGIFNAPGTAGATIDALSRNGLSNANPYTPDGGFNLEELAGGKGVNVMQPETPLGTDMKAAVDAPVTRAEGAAAQVSAAPDAAANKYAVSTAPNASALNAAGQSAAGSGLGVRLPNNALAPQESGNVVSRLFGDMSEKTKLGMLQGVGQALTGAMASKDAAKQRKAQMDWEKERYYNSTPSLRVVG